MLYVSTRGTAPKLGFEEAMLAGLARDGGLYVPEAWPEMTRAEIAALAGLPYPEAAFRVMRPFVADAFPDAEFRAILARAYAGFRHPAVAPLRQLGPNDWLLELFHGPTLAFKDVAMQLIGRLFEASLARSGRRVTIVGATSGDTGSAAIEAFRGRAGVEVFILFPDGRVSEVQRRQMTTPAEPNVHALAIAGDFDDAQARVKDMFNDHAFRDGVGLAGRQLDQLGPRAGADRLLLHRRRRPRRAAPAGQLHRADRQLRRHLRRLGREADGPADRPAGDRHQPERHPAPHADDRRAPPRRRAALDQPVDGHRGQLQLRAAAVRALRPRGSGRRAADGRARRRRLRAPAGRARPAAGRVRQRPRLRGGDAAAIAAAYQATGEVVCPHTAVGLHAAKARRGDPAVPMVVLATAHPAKFPDAVEAACGLRPALPPWMAELMTRPERMTRVANDLAAIEDVIGRETVR